MMLLLSAISTQAVADGAGVAVTEKFDPIPVHFIYPPLQRNSSADEALVSGRVIEGVYNMAEPASKRWRIAFLFPHIKDPYWMDCSYGLISEAKRLGVARYFPRRWIRRSDWSVAQDG